MIRTTANNFINLPLKTISASAASIIALAASESASSQLPPGSDPSVVLGYATQRAKLLAQYAGLNSPVGTISWNTGPETTMYMVKPLSRGNVNIATTNVLDSPLIDYRALSDPVDLEVLLELYKKNKAIMATPYMQVLGPTEVSPVGAGPATDAQIKAALLGNVVPTNAHMCCTAAMMRRVQGGVVDSDLKVYGVRGLRVIDASTFPIIPATGPSASVYMLGEKAAAAIKAEYGIA